MPHWGWKNDPPLFFSKYSIHCSHFRNSITYIMSGTKLKTQKIAKLEQFIRDDVFKISGRQLPEEFFEDETTKGRIWHFLMQESEIRRASCRERV